MDSAVGPGRERGEGSGSAGPDPESTLADLAARGFQYFLDHAHPESGLIADSTRPEAPASIAVVGFALAVYPVAVERGWMSRQDAVERSVRTLRFLRDTPSGPGVADSQYKGFFYHFLDLETGRRAGACEISTIDTALLLAGALAAASFFDGTGDAESEIRRLARNLYGAADWNWARNGGQTVTHGWTPEDGFLPYRWAGYDEALILYVLGLGSPTHPLPESSYRGWTSTYEWRSVYGIEYLYAGPLFTHQYSHVWVDFRGIRDEYMRGKGIDYFENSRRATLIHREYAVRNPLGFEAYCACCWGLTASDGPGPATRMVDGRELRFHDYLARGAPWGPDDGTLAPWGVVASVPFAPDAVHETIRHFRGIGLGRACPYAFEATFNASFPVDDEPGFWVSPWDYGLNQGPLVLMIENHRSGLLWDLLGQCPYVVDGLRRAGFRGGWL